MINLNSDSKIIIKGVDLTNLGLNLNDPKIKYNKILNALYEY